MTPTAAVRHFETQADRRAWQDRRAQQRAAALHRSTQAARRDLAAARLARRQLTAREG